MNEEIILNVETNSPYVIGAVAYVEQLENGAKITIVDKNGTTTATVYDGNDGKSISSITLNDDYTLTILYTDGDTTTTSSIRGATGASGVYYGEEEPIDPVVNVWVDPADGDGSVLKIRDEDDQWTAIESIVGEPAGFGTVTATVDANHGTPAVTVTTSGDDTAKNFAFAFSNLQPAPYDDSELQADFAVLQGQFDTAVAAVTTDTEVTDIRVGADGITDTTAGASVRRQFTDLRSNISAISAYKFGKNRFDVSSVTIGYYVNPANGTLASNGSHGVSDFIPVDNNIVISDNRGLANNGLRVCFYDSTKTYISGLSPSDVTGLYNADLLRHYVALTIPNNTAYIRFSTAAFTQTQHTWNIQVEYGTAPTAYEDFVGHRYATDAYINKKNQLNAQIVFKQMPSVSADTFSDEDVIDLPQITFHGRKSYSFFGLVTTMGTLRIGHESVYGGSYVLIDSTQVIVMVNYGSDSAYHTLNHGLAIADYIGVTLKVGTNGRASIEVSTNGGTYTHDNLAFPGRNGKIQAVSDGCEFTNVILSYASDCYRAKVWICGDSYLSNDNPNRWTYQAKAWGYDGFALVGYPGEASARGYADFEAALACGTPTYAVWAYGMNDGDSGAGINASWKENVEAFIEKCVSEGIVPILCTIPNTPTVSHLYKNAYVKASGLRYIDFAKAVNAETGNATWFSGMLSSDNVHPTEQGAVALASQALADMPELLLSF